MAKYTIKSPAKINIGLRVLSKREDGYHNIETIFYPIKLFDIINISISPFYETKISVSVSANKSKINLKDKKNICYKAAELFMNDFRIKGNYSIKIKILKKIPVGAGLGGGSSNAAAVLKILSRHFRKSKYKQIINKIALKLGSDVPFFLYGKPAYATGRGEVLVPLPKFKINYKILIVNPGINVSTAWAYKQIKRHKAKGKKINNIKSFKINYKDILVNDFEEPVFKKYPLFKKLKREMYNKGAVFASMSGSGSSVYGFFKR